MNYTVRIVSIKREVAMFRRLSLDESPIPIDTGAYDIDLDILSEGGESIYCPGMKTNVTDKDRLEELIKGWAEAHIEKFFMENDTNAIPFTEGSIINVEYAPSVMDHVS